MQPLVLLLDLDETLLRPRIPKVHKYDLASVDLSVTIPVNDGVRCDLSLRPGLGAFFDWIRERRSAGRLEGPWLFAQGHAAYVNAVLAEVDPEKDIFSDRVLSKESCTPTRTPWVLKDLTKVPCSGGGGAGSLQRMVLVDNNTMSCILAPENTLMVRDWLGAGAADAELERVSQVLDGLMERALEDAASGRQADYAGHLVQTMPRYPEFQRRLRDLRRRIDEPAPMGMSLRELHKELWNEACDAKRELLGLAPGEV